MKVSAIFLKLLFLLIFCSPDTSIGQGATMSDAIVTGTYAAGSFSYSDSRSNAGYGDEYRSAGSPYFGQPSEDIWYRFTVQDSAVVSVSTCASGFDTYIHLLSGDGTPLDHNDDYGKPFNAFI